MRVISYKSLGVQKSYDLEVNHPDHQFYLANGLLTSNSHAVAYSGISMYQAYIKAHYPLEFWASKLQAGETNFEDKESVWALRSLAMDDGIKFGEFSVNTCGSHIRVGSDNKLYWRLDFVKGVGTPAAAMIRKCAPYDSVTDLLDKTLKYFKTLKDAAEAAGTPIKGRGCPVGKLAIMALISAGALDSIYPEGTTRYDIATEYLRSYHGKKWELINSYVGDRANMLANKAVTPTQMKDISLLSSLTDTLQTIALQHSVLRFSPRPYWKIFQDGDRKIANRGPGVVAAMVHRAATGTPVRAYGMSGKLEVKKYSKGKMLVGFVNEYDGPIRFVMFQDQYHPLRNKIKMIQNEPFIWISGHIKEDHYNGGKQIIANDIGSIRGVENMSDEDISF